MNGHIVHGTDSAEGKRGMTNQSFPRPHPSQKHEPHQGVSAFEKILEEKRMELERSQKSAKQRRKQT